MKWMVQKRFYPLEITNAAATASAPCGHTIKCNYSIKDGQFWAVRILRIFPHGYHIFIE